MSAFNTNLHCLQSGLFAERSPRPHANTETGAIFVYNASATWGDDDNPPRGRVSGRFGRASQPPTLIQPTPAPSVDCRPLPRLHSQYKQRWRLFRSSRAIVAILRKIEGCKQSNTNFNRQAEMNIKNHFPNELTTTLRLQWSLSASYQIPATMGTGTKKGHMNICLVFVPSLLKPLNCRLNCYHSY